MMKHLTFAVLVDRFEGRLADSDVESISSHVAECRACEADYRKLSEFFGYVNQKPTEEVPQAATANILNIFQRRPAVEKPRTSVLSKIGVLVFDDWTTALNERYAGMDSRQLLYRADGFDIDLRIEFVGEQCIVTGQVFPECPGAELTLCSERTSVKASLNEMGEFTFDPVETGDYSLRIKNNEVYLEIENIPLHI